ncbi:MAG: ABC transporter permease [Bacteroidota bacterium]|nr:ABC transporter permease [Bacteroidota bacterium]
MRLPFFIARRYLFAKKSHNIINVISGISAAGIMIGTMALIIVLSVFNGFERVIVSLVNTFDPDIKISLVEGKTFHAGDIAADRIKRLNGVVRYTDVLEENALLRYNNRQYFATIKGVSPDYQDKSGLDSMLVEGSMSLESKGNPYAVIGRGVAYYLGVDTHDLKHQLEIYVPRRGTGAVTPDQAFNSASLFTSGIFAIQDDFDSKYVLLPIDFTRDLLEYNDEVTAVELGLAKEMDNEQIQQQIQQIVGPRFKVENRFQQQSTLYHLMKSEKLAVFFILGFILLIASFNVIGSLSMLIIEKKKDINILWSMGADSRLIRRIFLAEGLLVTTLGALLGLILGAAICWLQQRFGLVKLEASGGTFLIKAYPVAMEWFDFVMVFVTVFFIGLVAVIFPVRNITPATER